MQVLFTLRLRQCIRPRRRAAESGEVSTMRPIGTRPLRRLLVPGNKLVCSRSTHSCDAAEVPRMCGACWHSRISRNQYSRIHVKGKRKHGKFLCSTRRGIHIHLRLSHSKGKKMATQVMGFCTLASAEPRGLAAKFVWYPVIFAFTFCACESGAKERCTRGGKFTAR